MHENVTTCIYPAKYIILTWVFSENIFHQINTGCFILRTLNSFKKINIYHYKMR